MAKSNRLLNFSKKFCLGLGFLTMALLFGSASPALAGEIGAFCGAEGTADVAMVLDRTISLNQSERQEEILAARDLADAILDSPGPNMVGVAVFGGSGGTSASIEQPLTDDFNAVNDSLSILLTTSSIGVGTNIMAALEEGKAILLGGLNGNQALILLSDGRPNEPGSTSNAEAEAIAVANEIKDMGIRIFTIAFTRRASAQNFMRIIASPNSSFVTPDMDDLQKIFADILDILGCGDSSPCTVLECVDDACEEFDRDCDDNNPCTDDFCDPQTGCQSEFNDVCDGGAFTPEDGEGNAGAGVSGGGCGCDTTGQRTTALSGVPFSLVLFGLLISFGVWIRMKRVRQRK